MRYALTSREIAAQTRVVLAIQENTKPEDVAMKLLRMPIRKPDGESVMKPSTADTDDLSVAYERPGLFDLGNVRELTLGSSSSGNADSNSQYYW